MSGPQDDEPAEPSEFYILGPDGLPGPPSAGERPGTRPPRERHPSRSRSRDHRWAALGVAALLIFGLGIAVGAHLSGRSAATGTDRSGPASARATSHSSAAGSTSTGPASAGSTSTGASEAGTGDDDSPRDVWVTGTPLPAGASTGARLYLLAQESGRTSVLLYDVDTRRASPIPGLPDVPGWMNVVPIPGGVAVAGPPPGQSGGGPAMLYLVRGDRVVRHFRITGQTFPAGTGTALWQASWKDREPGWVQKIGLTGKLLTPRYPLPNRRILIRGTTAGLLTSTTEDPDRVQLWDPATGTVTHTFGRLIAADATRLAWTDSTCGSAGCALHVTDLPSSTMTFVDVPHPEAFSGSFSQAQNPPRLAVAVTEPGRIGQATTVRHVYEFDLSDGSAHLVPGLRLPPTADLDLAWSPTGRRLFITSMQAGTTARTLATWMPGAPTLNVVTTDVPAGTIATR